MELLRNARPSLKPAGILAIGEWLPEDENSDEATTPEKMTAQMKEAGYRLERVETFLKANNMYIYIFHPDGGRPYRPSPETRDALDQSTSFPSLIRTLPST